MSDQSEGLCLQPGCGRPAIACDECRRALALLDSRAGFASISRHPENGRGCRLCAAGEPEWCPEDLLQQALQHRQALGDQRATLDQLRSAAWQDWPQWWAWGGIGGLTRRA
jgi:hypothetical protein